VPYRALLKYQHSNGTEWSSALAVVGEKAKISLHKLSSSTVRNWGTASLMFTFLSGVLVEKISTISLTSIPVQG